MNNGSHLHTSSRETSRQAHSNTRRFASALGVTAMLHMTVPAPVSSSVVHLMDDTAGKAMNFVPPSPKTEANVVSNSRNILVKYTIQPGDTLGTLACVFGVSVESFMKYNPQIKDKHSIYAGKQLIVPNPSRNIAKCVIDVRGETKSMVDSKEKRTPIVGAQEPLSPEDFKKAFLADSTNVKMLAKYAKLHNMEVFQKIKNAHISKAKKQQKLFDLYANEHADFAARAYVQEIQSSNPDKQVVDGVETLLKEAGYTITAKNFLEAKMWTESSGGRSIGAIVEAQKLMKLYSEATLPKVKEKYETKIADTIKTAISWIVGPSNDVGPYGMRPGWVRAEQLNGWAPGVELKLVDDIHTLRQGVKKIFINAVKENLSQKEIMDQLIALDSRFDGQLMGEAALFSFQRIASNLTKKQGLTPEQAVKGANIDYNKGEGTTKRILQKKGHVVSTKYSDKMDVKLKLMSAINEARNLTTEVGQNKGVAQKASQEESLTSAPHMTYNISLKNVRIKKPRRSPAGSPLCSERTRKILTEKLGADMEYVDQNHAIELFHKWQKDGTGLVFKDSTKLKKFLLSRAERGKVLGDMTADTSTPDERKGHRFPSVVAEDGKLWILDASYGDGTSPILFDTYMDRHFQMRFKGKIVVNTRVGEIRNPSAKFVAKQKQPTPMKVIMASAPAEKASVPYIVHSNGTINLSQNVSASVVKLTDTVAGDNHLHAGIDIGDDKVLFPALSSARIRNRIDLIRAQIDILTSNITDPVVKARIEKKLGENPAWTMAKNIKLQKNRYMKGGNVQALKNAKGLYELLMMCEREIAKIPAFNKMTA